MGLSLKKAGKVKKETNNLKIQSTKKKSRVKKMIKWFIFIAIFVIIAMVVNNRFVGRKLQNAISNAVTTQAKVEKRDIQNTLTSSGAIEPLNTYVVKTLVEGEVISADFEEGKQVKEGDTLYQITTENLDNKIESSETNVTRAEKDYEKSKRNYEKANESYMEAVADYEKAKADYGDLAITADTGGIITEVLVEEGDQLQEGTQIAKIYDNSSMLLEVYFNANQASGSLVGKTAKIELSDTSEVLTGTVTKASEIEEVLSGNRIVKKVTIKVKNPGGLTTSSTATATIGDLYSSETGTFKVLEDTVLKADKSGKVATLKISEGSRVKNDEVLLTLDKTSNEDKLESYEKAVNNAKDSLDNAADSVESASESIEDAKSSLEEVIDSKTDYSVKAPIAGQVIRKTALLGDTISSNSELCIIYDLSAVTFEMSVDELDVKSVAVGQTVNITADALEGVKITGEVTNISLESTNSGGVTQYPVTVRIDEVGELLPGMNVTGEIVVEEAKDVLAVPTDALMRGDVVYVADESVTESVGDIPAGFRAVQVETGLTDGDYIEIISGLTGDEEVYTMRIASGTTEGFPMQGGFNFGNGGGQGMQGGGDFSGGTRPSGGSNSGTSSGNFGGGNRP
ncbi:MAG: secretion protein HlyD family protein [Anaerocolumna sp.]|jgi:HlyD family secretion protein|nr:secretion protein HlyD family protein [Anaerocolumna sp.]